ncbi:Na+/H+ antiporter subunit E [Sinorhizobium sojae]|uniref:Na+/H+ antiporter subunit E n=1 Tax=Sinorhizobium sojae TaxID=716925 RepID=UPI0012F77505|nr:Na+/H+ antiporter subunit E [Sinorhizobium sojae]
MSFLVFWIVIMGGDINALVPGLFAAGAAAWLGGRLAPANEPSLDLLEITALAPRFLRRSMAGGLDVAWRAFHPKLPLNPGWVVYRPHRLPPGVSRVVLGSEISLLPGTLVAGSKGDSLLIHCLDVRAAVVRQIVQEESEIAGAVRNG